MDSENKRRARGGFDAFPGKDTGDTNPSGLGFVLGIAAAITSIAAAFFAVFAASAGAAASTGLAVAVAVLIAVVARIIALVGRFGVSPVWPILGFVTTIGLLFLAAYSACESQPAEADCQQYYTNPDGSSGCADGWM